MADDPTIDTDSGESPEVPGLGKVLDLQIESELKDSYLTYAMSTIMDRALPDVRDGLKPSQRRILVAMNDLNLRPGKKHIKSAKIAGDTSGNYHPHGEGVIYPTLVGMAQKWKMSVPLIDSQGNFGSIDGDPPAAMRYTEARMHHGAMDMLEDIKLDTVDFQPNYDDRLMEPTVLPGKFPNLIINGGVGIAVGMATSLLPHNPSEVFDGITRVIDNPEISLAELMADETDEAGTVSRLGIKGPDFPTGGIIRGRGGIGAGYSTGRGKLVVRGKVHIEDLKNGKQQIVIDEIPYQLIQSTLVERIVGAIKDERIKDIVDVRNESGRDAQTRIVCELRKGTDPAVVENQLYQFTPLQSTISIMNIALVNRQPRTLSIKELLQHYIDHRIDVIERRTRHLLHEAKKRAHVLEGMIYAVCDIDEVIKLIRSSKTRPEAIEKLRQKAFRIGRDHAFVSQIPERLLAVASADGGVGLTRVQAEAIGSMRLIQLVGLEIEKLTGEYREVVEKIEDYEDILARPERVRAIIKDDIAEMKPRFHRERRTRIEEWAGDIEYAALIQEHRVAVTISHHGYVKRVPLDTYKSQGRGGRGVKGSTNSRDDDFIEQLLVCSTHDDLLCFTDTGRVFKRKVYEIPEGSRTSKGRSVVNLIDMKPGERCVQYLPISEFEKGEDFLTFATAQGKVKRSSLKLYQNVNKSGLIAVSLNDGDSLVGVECTSGHDHLLLAAASGRAIRFPEGDARAMGRNSAGVKGIELAGDDSVVGLVKIQMEDADDATSNTREGVDLLTVTEHGFGKRTDLLEYLVASEGDGGAVTYRTQSRGGKGRIDIKTTARNGRVVAVRPVIDGEDVVFVTSSGMIVRVQSEEIRRIGRNTAGVRVVNLKSDYRLVSAAVTPRDED